MFKEVLFDFFLGGGAEMPDKEGCLRVKEPWRFLLEAAALRKKRGGDGLGSISTTLGYVPFLITAFLTDPPVALLLAATQGGLVNLRS